MRGALAQTLGAQARESRGEVSVLGFRRTGQCRVARCSRCEHSSFIPSQLPLSPPSSTTRPPPWTIGLTGLSRTVHGSVRVRLCLRKWRVALFVLLAVPAWRLFLNPRQTQSTAHATRTTQLLHPLPAGRQRVPHPARVQSRQGPQVCRPTTSTINTLVNTIVNTGLRACARPRRQALPRRPRRGGSLRPSSRGGGVR